MRNNARERRARRPPFPLPSPPLPFPVSLSERTSEMQGSEVAMLWSPPAAALAAPEAEATPRAVR